MAANPNIKITVDTSSFDKNVQEFMSNDLKNLCETVLKTAGKYFAVAAARMTPPCVGSNSIKRKYYSRPVLSLKKLVKNQYTSISATPEDYIKLKQGYRFKVVNKTISRNRLGNSLYVKNLQEAKILSKIENRGLHRIMWRIVASFGWRRSSKFNKCIA